MKYAAHNALRFLKNSIRYVIVCGLVALRQRMIRTKLRFRTEGQSYSRYNRYILAPGNTESSDWVARPEPPAMGVARFAEDHALRLRLFPCLQQVHRDLGVGDDAR